MKWWHVLTTFAVLTALGAMTLRGQAGGDPPKDATYIKVEIKGTIETGIMAIGGESTGTIIKTSTMTLELDFGKNKELRQLAEKLNGKVAIATGTLTSRKGVAIKLRHIVTVTDLKEAPAK